MQHNLAIICHYHHRHRHFSSASSPSSSSSSTPSQSSPSSSSSSSSSSSFHQHPSARAPTLQEHLQQETVQLKSRIEPRHVDLFDQLEGQTLKVLQHEEHLPESSSWVVLPVTDVVLQVHLDLPTNQTNPAAVAQTTASWKVCC